MKKLTITLIITILIAYAGTSQRLASDSITCLPNSQLKAAINVIETCKVTAQELQITKNKVIILENASINKDKIIKELGTISVIKDSIAEKYNQMYKEAKIELKDAEKLIDKYKEKEKKHNINRWICYGLGILTGVFLIK